MTDNGNNAAVNIVVGHNEVRIEGSENFISTELSTILETLDLQSQPKARPDEETVQSELTNLTNGESVNSENSNEKNENSELEEVAESLGVSPNHVRRHFFVDGEELHIENPLNIKSRYALLGYCAIESQREDKDTFDNPKMKRKLINQEGIEINEWGDFLYRARNRGDIRDDPNSDQQYNKPFRLTRDGRDEFIDWLKSNNK